MPTYSYLCEQCGHKENHWQKISDPVLKTCPSCHQDHYIRQVSAPSFQLKGSGWYATDFKSPASSNTESPSTTPSSTSQEAPATGCGASCACHSDNSSSST